MPYLIHTYTKKMFFVHLKLKFDCASFNLPGNLIKASVSSPISGLLIYISDFQTFFKDTDLLSKEILPRSTIYEIEQSCPRWGRGGQPELSSHLLLNAGLPWVLFQNQGSIVSAIASDSSVSSSPCLEWPSQLKILQNFRPFMTVFSATRIFHMYTIMRGKEHIFRYSRSRFQSPNPWDMAILFLLDSWLGDEAPQRPCIPWGWGVPESGCVWRWGKHGLLDHHCHYLAGWPWDLASLKISLMIIQLLL